MRSDSPQTGQTQRAKPTKTRKDKGKKGTEDTEKEWADESAAMLLRIIQRVTASIRKQNFQKRIQTLVLGFSPTSTEKIKRVYSVKDAKMRMTSLHVTECGRRQTCSTF